MKYQCAKCETIFEHEKYLTECDGEKTCPICDTMEVVYKLSNPLEHFVIKESEVKRTVLLAKIIDHIHYCPIGYDYKGMIVSKMLANEDMLNWIKKLHKLSKQSL